MILALAGAVALGACAADGAGTSVASRAGQVPLMDQTGTIVAWAPESAIRNAPFGTPVVINRGGQSLTVTVGPRQGQGVVAGDARVIGTDAGAPIIERVGAAGDLSREGVPVVVGTDQGRPITVMMSQEDADRFQRAQVRRGGNRAPVAPSAR
jgi:hypothetical protein